MREADLVVVGAGFAGLACAQAAALRGVRTVVLDRKRFAGEKIHTTGILVKEVADFFDVPRQWTRKVAGVRLYAPNLKSVDLAAPGYHFLATETAAVLRWMAEQAEGAGAELRWGARFQGVVRDGGGAVLPGHGVRARFVAGCDGARSRVAAHLGLGRNRQYLLGVEAEWEGMRGVEEGVLHVFLDSVWAPGYIGWVVPGTGITQVGLAVRAGRMPRLEGWMGQLRRVFDFSAAREIGRRGGYIPCGGLVKPWHGEGVLLLGDAAGTVSPLTAGGIHPALELGRLAGVALADHLLDGGPHPAEVLRRTVPRYAAKGLMRAAFSAFPPPNALYNRVLEWDWFQRLARTVFFHHRGLMSARAWKDIMGLEAGTGVRER
jgi:flavin-dependent dehydrogenase